MSKNISLLEVVQSAKTHLRTNKRYVFTLKINPPLKPEDDPIWNGRMPGLREKALKENTLEIHVVYDVCVKRPKAERGHRFSPALNCVIIGKFNDQAHNEERQVIPPDDESMETAGSMLNDLLADHFGGNTLPHGTVIEGDNWMYFFDELQDLIEKKTGVSL